MLVGAVLESPNDGVLVLGAADAVALPNVNPPAEGALVIGGATAVNFERSPNPFVDVIDVGALEVLLNKPPPPAVALLPNPEKFTGTGLVMGVADDKLVVGVSALPTAPNENNPCVGAELFSSAVLVAAESPVLPDVILPKL